MSKQDILDYFSDINYAYNETTRLDTLSRMLDELVEQAASPWHRVEEEPPEIGKIVLVYDDLDRLSICKLDKQYRWLRQGGGWFDVPYVRYWMPIEPPKEEADEP